MKIFKYILILLVVCFSSCSYLQNELTKDDITQYIKAYENLAKVSPEIDEAMRKSQSLTVFSCRECQNLMSKAVKDAGYSDFKTFMLMDLRIIYTMRYLAYLKITKIVGETSSDIPVEDLCSDPKLRLNLDEKEKEKVDKYCSHAVVFTGYIENISTFFKGLATELMKEGDFKLVGEYYQEIFSAITNDKLSESLNHSNDGDWDD